MGKPLTLLVRVNPVSQHGIKPGRSIGLFCTISPYCTLLIRASYVVPGASSVLFYEREILTRQQHTVYDMPLEIPVPFESENRATAISITFTLTKSGHKPLTKGLVVAVD